MTCGSAVSQLDMSQGSYWFEVCSIHFSLTSGYCGFALPMEVHRSVRGNPICLSMFRVSLQMISINILLTKANQNKNKG